MNLDFADSERTRHFERARELITQGYRILRDDVGADNPADNAFLREATICAHQHLVWLADRGGSDARSHVGAEVEIKSTRLDSRSTIAFPTSRYVSKTVIARFRSADWWAFGIFDRYESLVALYRVDQFKMRPLIDHLEQKMKSRMALDQALENNPKFPFALIRERASVLYFDSESYREVQSQRRWTIEQR